MKRSVGIFLIVLLSCQNRQAKTNASVPSADTAGSRQEVISQVALPVLEELFADSTNIGRKLHNKIELAKYRSGDSVYVVINFFSKQHSQWALKNSYQFEKDKFLGCDPKLSDFNNDGLNDVTYVYDIAARSANDLRRLFVYDNRSDQLVYVRNSEEYPNLHYNKYLNCIDAWRVYGGCMSEFLRLNGDSLVRFASVELYEGLTVSTYDPSGKETILLRDSTTKVFLARFKNYKPLQEYGENDF